MIRFFLLLRSFAGIHRGAAPRTATLLVFAIMALEFTAAFRTFVRVFMTHISPPVMVYRDHYITTPKGRVKPSKER